MLLLVNKSDYLTPLQRRAWHDFLSNPDEPWEHVFFSATDQQRCIDEEAARQAVLDAEATAPLLLAEEGDDDAAGKGDDEASESGQGPPSVRSQNGSSKDVGVDFPLSRTEFLDWLRRFAKEKDCETDPKYDRLSFGMLGFPNVGKSSVINVLMGNAKHAHGVVRVGVAAQPGKTKHFQTLLLPDQEDLMPVSYTHLTLPTKRIV